MQDVLPKFYSEQKNWPTT